MLKYHKSVELAPEGYAHPDRFVHYKTYAGPADHYDKVTSYVFPLFFHSGLREDTCLLDIGCGPLRLGRFLIVFLRPELYHGLEPEKEVVELALQEEIVRPYGKRLLEYKNPKFLHNSTFDLSGFQTKFDMVIAEQVFIHCGTEQLIQCLRSVKGHLKPSGRFILQVNIGDFDTVREKRFTDEWSYRHASHSGMWYREDTFRKLLEAEGWQYERPADLHWVLTIPPVTFM